MARRISILTVGTLGDVSPMIVLGRALADLGFEVSIAAPENFRDLIASAGLQARRCGADFSAFMKENEVSGLSGAATLTQLLAWRFPGPRVRAMFEGVLRDAVAASADADAILFHPFISIASDIAEARSIPAILVPMALLSPTVDTPLAVLARPGNPAWNRMSYAFLRLQRPPFLPIINDIRRTLLGLGRSPRYKHPHTVHGRPVPVLYPVSPSLMPLTGHRDDIHFTGYWFRDETPDWQPTGALARFLAAGRQPIYIGFGSMPGLGGAETAMLLAAVTAAGERAILGRGWGSFETPDGAALPDTVHVIDDAPHAQLFRHVGAVIHHGGLGTLSTGLRAGRPTLVVPFMLDQPHWGHRVAELGCGPPPIKLADWSVERLTAAIRDLVANPAYRKAAADIGAAMSKECGAVDAARVVTEIVGAPRAVSRPAHDVATARRGRALGAH